MTNCNLLKSSTSAGSALILTVVLTSMLAIVGVLFVMMARVDKVATSAISENRELDLAVETVIAKISQQLVLDVPGIIPWQEYYDYPDVNNAWLASLEPYQFAANEYRWRHISDVNNQLGPRAWDLRAVIVPDYQLPSQVGDTNAVLGFYPADPDGDGVSDSVWVKLRDMTSSKGEPIYAAIRVVDNEAMLNVNTAWKFEFDPNVVMDANRIDGSSQTQINLMALSCPPGFTVYDPCDEIDLLRARANPALGLNPLALDQYEQNVIWRYVQPNGPYTPFDISDELELRYRYLLNHTGIDTRLEPWGGEFRKPTELDTPVDSGGQQFNDWFYRSQHDVLGPNDIYSYRHLATTYNMDRIIDPNGDRMININRETSPWKIYDRLIRGYPGIVDPFTRRQYAQLAVNMVDFADKDPNVTTLVDPNGVVYYGFDAQPFITEVAWKIHQLPESGLNYYALELYNPFNTIIDLNNVTSQECFELELNDRVGAGPPIHIGFRPFDRINPGSYFVIANYLSFFAICPYDPNCRTNVKQDTRLNFFGSWILPDKSKPVVDRRADPDKGKPPIYVGWTNNYDVFLKRRVFVPALGAYQWIYVDKWLIEPYLAQPGEDRFFGRSQNDWHVVYQTPPPPTIEISPYLAGVGRLGTWNGLSGLPEHYFSFFLPNPLNPVREFITVGDIPRILTLGNDPNRTNTIGEQLGRRLRSEEYLVRLNLANPYHRNVFQYLTVFDPNSDNIDNDADGLIDAADIRSPEVQIPGRININTAPWYVIAQLPWVSQRINQPLNYSLAQAIVAYRDKLAIPPVDYSGLTGRFNATGIVGVREQPGFASTGELNFVVNNTGINNYNIAQYALDTIDLPGFPDLTTADDDLPFALPDPGDEVIDDFEERDVIFSRISNLVSVRSDVFTAYILVRIGADGPQKRAIAILDRSGVSKTNVSLPDGKVRIVALHYVPDPR